jgi:hypothetical protein
MTKEYVTDHRTLSKYLDDQLCDQERQAFEAYWTQNPDVIDDLEAHAQLQAGLARLRQTGELERLLQRRTRSRRTWTLALAACLVALAVLITLRAGSPPSQAPAILIASATALSMQGRKPPEIETLEVLHTRSGAFDAMLQLTQPRKFFELRVLPNDGMAQRYAASLRYRNPDRTRTELAAVGDLRPARDGFVIVFLDSRRLRPGVHELQLVSDTPPSVPTHTGLFLINVVAAADR